MWCYSVHMFLIDKLGYVWICYIYIVFPCISLKKTVALFSPNFRPFIATFGRFGAFLDLNSFTSVCIFRTCSCHPCRSKPQRMQKRLLLQHGHRGSGGYVDVSENSGTPKSSILIGFSIINHPFWGTPIFGNTHVIAIGHYWTLNWIYPCFSCRFQILVCPLDFLDCRVA